jgi:hypothetical protein
MLLVVMTSRRNASTWAADAPSSLSKELSQARGKSKSGAPASSSSRPAEAPAPVDKVPAIPQDSKFPLTPGSTPKAP